MVSCGIHNNLLVCRVSLVPPWNALLIATHASKYVTFMLLGEVDPSYLWILVHTTDLTFYNKTELTGE